jgi:hypothetical protein
LVVTEPSEPLRNPVNKIFGDELPQATVDERVDDSPAEESEHDKWLRDNIPPHHE